MILDLVSTLLLIALVGTVVIALLSPIESLRWWAGGSGEVNVPLETAPLTGPAPGTVLVYLSGIGSISGDELLSEEGAFLDRLEPLLQDTVVIRDVFPYSVVGVGLTGARSFAGLWRALDRMRLNGDQALSALINVRNLFQVAVAADPRYGPIFSQGVAQVIAHAAAKAGFRPGGEQRLVLLGYSGGAQVAVGAAPYLHELLHTTVHVVSVGGVLDSSPGLKMISALDHLVGERDVMERIGRIVYPGRWPIAAASAWNTGRREGVVHVKVLPGMAHNTPGGYMDPAASTSSGESYPDVTAELIAAQLSRA